MPNFPAPHFPGYRSLVAGVLYTLMLTASAQAAAVPSNATRAPLVIYTDIASGPNSGGEGNKGIYLSIFGKNFSSSGLGNSGLGKTVKVFVNNVEVDNYRYLGASRGRPDIDQITVQVGALGNPKPATPLPIKVVVGGLASNTNVSFMVNPGRILFVDNVAGNDATAVIGDIKHPFRHVQTPNLRQGAWGAVRAGDFIVMRGTGTDWTDYGFENYFIRFRDKSGTAPSGVIDSGPITLMGYPAENVFINHAYNAALERAGSMGGISAVNGSHYAGLGQWVTISNLKVEDGNHDGPINVEVLGNHWRVINNELTANTAVANPDAKGGGIVGNGYGEVFLGNHIHDIFCGRTGTGPYQNHGIYIDGDGTYEIAYNLIEEIPGGSGFQIYVNGSNGSTVTNHVSFHHNVIHHVAKHGINVADGTQNDINIYNNVVYGTNRAGIRFNTRLLHGARIYNNTFYDTNTEGGSIDASVMNDWNLPRDALDMENNIFAVHPGTRYVGGSVGFSGSVGLVIRNAWYGGTGSVGLDIEPVSGNPKFVSAGRDFHLIPGSPVIDAGSAAVSGVVTNDFDVSTTRPQGKGFDIGAYELIP